MPTGKDVLAVAVKELGTKEYPANSNRVKYNTWYYGKEVSGAAYPWCMAFVQWCYAQAGIPLPLKTASCGALLRWYQEHDPACIVKEPVVGCIVIFDFPGGAATDHTGLFESRTNSTVTTIDGNTGTTSDANGGAVMRRTRSISYAKPVYIKPRAIWNEEDLDMTKAEFLKSLTDDEAREIVEKANRAASKLPPSDYAKDACRRGIESGLFTDGDHDGLVDNPQAYMKRQELATVLDRRGLLKK